MNQISKSYSNWLIWAFFGCILLITAPSFAQKPEIKSIDKTNGGVADVVTIKGDNFGDDASKLAVFFGAAKGSIVSAANQVIEVRVPPGATFDNISVINLNNGLIGYTDDRFLLSYGGNHPFSNANLEGQFDFDAEKGLYDLCMCDFDGDNRVDVATASDNSSSIKILPNNSTGPGNVSFNSAFPSLPLATRTIHSRCGDLNGDGKPDLVVSEGGDGDRIFIFKNNSTGAGNFNFSSQSITLSGRKTKRIEIADLDLDGKPELIITDQGSNLISILVNQSTTGTVQFSATPINVTVTGAGSTDGIDIADLNGDNLPELVVSQFLTATSNLFIIENKSIPGTISLGSIIKKDIGSSVVNIKIGDLDGDGKQDIAVTQLLASSLSIFLNQSTASSIAFANPKSFVTSDRPWGLALGDLDGDGKADIVAASLTQKAITILNNESTPGNLSFQKLTANTTYINRHVQIGDVDGDGKPDVLFTSIDDNNANILASKVSVFRNKSCMVPAVTPEGPLSVCSGFPLRLFATVSRGTSYQWKDVATNTVYPATTNPYFDVTVSGKYQVTATSEGGSCAEVSNTVDVTVGAGITSGVAVATNNGPLCLGNSLQLSVNDVSATQYKWTGPDGYSGTGLNPPPVNNFQEKNVGRYYLDVIVGGCVAQQTSTVVEAIDIGSFKINYPGSNVICQGDTKTLTLSRDLPGASYEWFKGATNTGVTTVSYMASETNDYYVKIGYPGCSNVQTDPVSIKVAAIPSASFTVSTSTACAGQLIQFNNQSTSDPDITPVYTWTFGDSNTSSEENPKHSYSIAGTFNAKLRVAYTGDACPNETPTTPITVQSAPVPSITNPDSKYKICSGENLTLQVIGSYNSYLWSTGEQTASISVTEPGTYSVEVTTSTCTLNASRDIEALPSPTVIVLADPERINEGGSSQLTAQGLTTYQWSPADGLSNPSIANPVASPTVTTTYTVTGLGENGCMGTGMFELIVKGEAIVTKLTPKSFFTPNDDDMNAQWKVEHILDFPQCGVAIYDDKGIKVFESKPYLNDWDGTFNGKRLPQGVYFYIIKCDGEENTPKAGSITLLR